jgi:hypothetical protein
MHELPGPEVKDAARFVGLPPTAATDKMVAAYMDGDGGLAIDFTRGTEGTQRVYLDPDSGRWLALMCSQWREANRTDV